MEEGLKTSLRGVLEKKYTTHSKTKEDRIVERFVNSIVIALCESIEDTNWSDDEVRITVSKDYGDENEYIMERIKDKLNLIVCGTGYEDCEMWVSVTWNALFRIYTFTIVVNKT